MNNFKKIMIEQNSFKNDDEKLLIEIKKIENKLLKNEMLTEQENKVGTLVVDAYIFVEFCEENDIIGNNLIHNLDKKEKQILEYILLLKINKVDIKILDKINYNNNIILKKINNQK